MKRHFATVFTANDFAFIYLTARDTGRVSWAGMYEIDRIGDCVSDYLKLVAGANPAKERWTRGESRARPAALDGYLHAIAIRYSSIMSRDRIERVAHTDACKRGNPYGILEESCDGRPWNKCALKFIELAQDIS